MTISKAGRNSTSVDRIDELLLVIEDLTERIDELEEQEVGGAALVTTFFSGTIVLASGAAAQPMFTLTPPAGQRVVINQLTTTATNTLTGVSVAGSDVGLVVDELTLATVPNLADRFCVGYVQSTTNGAGVGAVDKLVFGVDEVVAVSRNSATTNTEVRYSYSYVEG